jgi:hypothetical protein
MKSKKLTVVGKGEIMSNEKEKSCCGCACCDSKEVASFLRHLAEFFDKKK